MEGRPEVRVSDLAIGLSPNDLRGHVPTDKRQRESGRGGTQREHDGSTTQPDLSMQAREGYVTVYRCMCVMLCVRTVECRIVP